jgi:hypothetical protein
MQKLELAEQVFRPGNLIHGTSIFNLVAILNEGLQIPTDSRGKIYPTLDRLCTSLMSRASLPDRYLAGQHHGPKDKKDAFNAALVFSREKVLRDHLARTRAIGSAFWAYKQELLWQYSQAGTEVYGIPIEVPRGDFYYDEVAIYRKDAVVPVLGQEFTEGIVVRDMIVLERVKRSIEQQVRLLNPMPFFNFNCELIDTLS